MAQSFGHGLGLELDVWARITMGQEEWSKGEEDEERGMGCGWNRALHELICGSPVPEPAGWVNTKDPHLDPNGFKCRITWQMGQYRGSLMCTGHYLVFIHNMVQDIYTFSPSSVTASKTKSCFGSGVPHNPLDCVEDVMLQLDKVGLVVGFMTDLGELVDGGNALF